MPSSLDLVNFLPSCRHMEETGHNMRFSLMDQFLLKTPSMSRLALGLMGTLLLPLLGRAQTTQTGIHIVISNVISAGVERSSSRLNLVDSPIGRAECEGGDTQVEIQATGNSGGTVFDFWRNDYKAAACNDATQRDGSQDDNCVALNSPAGTIISPNISNMSMPPAFKVPL